MKGIFTVGLISTTLLGSPVLAGDVVCGGGSTQHGRIVTRLHRTYFGASPAPTSAVVVQQAPAMMAAPHVMMMPTAYTGPVYASASAFPGVPTYAGYGYPGYPTSAPAFAAPGFAAPAFAAPAFANPAFAAPAACSGPAAPAAPAACGGKSAPNAAPASNDGDIEDLKVSVREIKASIRLLLEKARIEAQGAGVNGPPATDSAGAPPSPSA